jgi:DNA-binding GntR family transcriptional regulator
VTPIAQATDTSLASTIHHALRDRIVRGELSEGSRLVERTICQEFKVSRGIVREALLRLANLALVRLVPDAGAIVAERTPTRVIDAFVFREAVETIAAEQCGSRMNREQVAHLMQTAEAFRKLWESRGKDRHERLIRLEEAFHGAIVKGSGNEFLQRGWETALLNLYRGSNSDRDNVIYDDEGRRLSVDDHLAIATAIQQGDGVRAGQTMKRHLQEARELLVKRLRNESILQEPAERYGSVTHKTEFDERQ